MNKSMYPDSIFFQGVVEDVVDPDFLDRVRVRVFGIHSEKKLPTNTTGIATEDLPWAWVGKPVTSASISGKGRTHELVPGTWIYGFTRDGDSYQDLLVIGTIPGIPFEKPSTATGFSDPAGIYPRADMIGESDINRLARNQNIDSTIVKTKKDSIEKDVDMGAGETWNEPSTPYNAVYPNNHVHESESGHIEEVDDTPGAERTHRYHRTGTFTEVHPDGTRVEKIVGSDYEIVVEDKKVLVKGNCSVTVLGDAEVFIAGNATTTIKQNETRTVEGDLEETIKGNVTRTYEKNVTETTGGNKSSVTTGNDTIKGALVLIN